MGRKRKEPKDQKERKTPTKFSPILQKHAGEITEPWRILESLISQMASWPRFEHLSRCKIRLFWVKDWKADADGIAVGAQVCKANEVDRILVEESKGETPDIFIKLPKVQWPNLDDTEKEHRIFHELCHIRQALDANGHQKRDTKDRPLWRLGRCPIKAFPEEIDRFGIDRVLGHHEAIARSIEIGDRPLLAEFDKAEKKVDEESKGDEAWRKLPLKTLELPGAVEKFLAADGFTDIGQLSSHIDKEGGLWAKRITVKHARKPKRFEEAIIEGFREFWSSRTGES